jgi:hypothetical protein
MESLIQKENEIIAKHHKILSELVDTESNINVESKPKRKNQKIIINPIEVKSVDVDTYKKLLEKEEKRKLAMKKYKANETEEQKSRRLEYLRQYSKENRNVEKEKEVYQKNKEHKKEVTARNMKKYLKFYKMYKDKHPEFENDLDSEKGSE